MYTKARCFTRLTADIIPDLRKGIFRFTFQKGRYSSSVVNKNDGEKNMINEKQDKAKKTSLFLKYVSDVDRKSNVDIQSVKGMQDDLHKLETDVARLRSMKNQLVKEAKQLVRLKRTKITDDIEDPNVPTSSIHCGGCGAFLQCNDRHAPGFMFQHKFKPCSEQKLQETLCHRCHRMIAENRDAKDGAIIEVNVNRDKYSDIVKQIKKDIALVVMVIDLTDIANSVIPDYLSLIGKRRPLFIVGNKVDLIPQDNKKYLKRIEERLVSECVQSNLNPRDNNIRHVCLISAKTGYGIEELINKLFSLWETKGNVYLVGTANSGKSTLFNRFLDSDYCKHTCRDIVQRATMSRWPGTTLDVLRFPIFRTTDYRLALRAERLTQTRENDAVERELKKEKLKTAGKSHNALLFGTVGKTNYKTEEDVHMEEKKFVTTGQDFSSYTLATDGSIDISGGKTARDVMTARRIIPESMYRRSVWTYDTPGLINHDQVITRLTVEELRILLKCEMLRPRVFVMRPGDVMLASGLARIDYLKGSPNTFFTVHIPHRLPVHVLRACEADDFYREHLGTPTLGLPLGDRLRTDRLASLVGREFHISTREALIASTDLQLSSLGWVSFAGQDKCVHIRAYTPAGRGMHLRTPALLPNIMAFKGRRMANSRQYAMKRLSV